MMSKLEGKVAVVTGASKGIGAGIARALAKEGAAVVVNYASSRGGADARRGGDHLGRRPGHRRPGRRVEASEAQGLIDAAVQEFGRLDVLVNNSGVYEFAAIEDFTEEHYRRQFDINVLGVLLTTQAAVKHLGEGASIVNISSAITHVHTPTAAAYAGTKGALNAISGVLANELAPRKIRVNVVSPGFVVTEGTHTAGVVGSEMEAGFVAQTPLGRAGHPDDIADVVAFLASDEARWLTGEVITASGGIR